MPTSSQTQGCLRLKSNTLTEPAPLSLSFGQYAAVCGAEGGGGSVFAEREDEGEEEAAAAAARAMHLEIKNRFIFKREFLALDALQVLNLRALLVQKYKY